jgi:hypothetical protein
MWTQWRTYWTAALGAAVWEDVHTDCWFTRPCHRDVTEALCAGGHGRTAMFWLSAIIAYFFFFPPILFPSLHFLTFYFLNFYPFFFASSCTPVLYTLFHQVSIEYCWRIKCRNSCAVQNLHILRADGLSVLYRDFSKSTSDWLVQKNTS